MGCIRRLLNYIVPKQLVSYGNIVDYLYRYFVEGINDPRKYGLTPKQGRAYAHRLREICFADHRIRAILKYVYKYIKELEPVIVVYDSYARCKLCGHEFRFLDRSLKYLMIMFVDHLRRNHREFLEQVIDEIIDSVKSELKVNNNGWSRSEGG